MPLKRVANDFSSIRLYERANNPTIRNDCTLAYFYCSIYNYATAGLGYISIGKLVSLDGKTDASSRYQREMSVERVWNAFGPSVSGSDINW